MPDIFPQPTGNGTHKKDSDTHFFLRRFHAMKGRLPQNTTEWEECFSNGFEQFFEAEEEAQGFDEEMAALRKGIMEKVILRLLRPLETDGNEIQPCLVHRDLWDGNTSVDSKTNKPLIFDACSSYAHHEHELAP
ncbi:Fructosamine/Ketosamine-3-kinase [Penicillium cf. griseofulvum]|uniref:protein-ribulosamine 3-kinase n=1 Tax=Penicillium cf. griseofulvum TaxID=2972120 RepID=A0A9W9JM80_9EURO|nr:Fructosamine/Ketosamine-3-kinase [Penicillium cf. griseofulvum]KAJ5442306.1 Fructosamine/Ketosamine-3-kinase [Penicillium cf. griseofulvum]